LSFVGNEEMNEKALEEKLRADATIGEQRQQYRQALLKDI